MRRIDPGSEDVNLLKLFFTLTSWNFQEDELLRRNILKDIHENKISTASLGQGFGKALHPSLY